MKTRLTWFLLLGAALGAAFWFSNPLSATEKKVLAARDNNVVMTKKEIVLPGTTVSKADGEAMNKILNHYDKTLFRIDTYENGKRTKTLGTLTDLITNKRLASDLTAAVKNGFSQYAIRVLGFDDHPTISPTPKAIHPSPAPKVIKSAQNSGADTKDSFDELQRILKKYQKK
jgi:hypothetical protein